MRRAADKDLIDPARLARGVLALDLSSSVGWAFANGDAAARWPMSRPYSDVALVPPEPRPASVRFGTKELGRGLHGVRGALLSEFLRAATSAPGVVVIEQAIPAKARRANQASMEIALGLRMVVGAWAAQYGVEVRECPVQSAKSWFGSALVRDKAPMIATANAIGWPVRSDHEADALAILDLTLARNAMASRLAARAA